MKRVVTIARIIIGVLFIFSGIIKAIDPLGLCYKMQEFFEVWAADGHIPWMMNTLHDHAMILASIVITLEVALGVAVLIGWQKRFTLWVLLVLSIFFTFFGVCLFHRQSKRVRMFWSLYSFIFLRDFFERSYIISADHLHHHQKRIYNAGL